MNLYPTSVISIPDAPAIVGLIFRQLRPESDFPLMLHVSSTSEIFDRQHNSVTLENVVRNYAKRETFNPARDVILAEVDEQLVGYGRVYWWSEINEGPLIFESLGFVLPEWRRQGIGRILLHWLENRAHEIAEVQSPTRAKFLQGFANPVQVAKTALFEKSGYAPIRQGNEMVRPTLDDIADFPLPYGVELRPAQPEHYRTIWEAAREAFRDHWGAGEETEDDYQEWLADPILMRTELWRVAWDVATNQIAGQVRTFINPHDNAKYNRKRGYTEYISVGRPWRKRGLARALISRSLNVQKAQGMTESALSVDSKNLSGATRVYEDCGFHVENATTFYRKPM